MEPVKFCWKRKPLIIWEAVVKQRPILDIAAFGGKSLIRILGEEEKNEKKEIGGLPTKTSATLPLCVFQSLLQGSAEARSVIWRKCEKSRFGENYQSNSKCLAKCIFSASNLWLVQSQQQSVGKLKSGAHFVRTRKKEQKRVLPALSFIDINLQLSFVTHWLPAKRLLKSASSQIGPLTSSYTPVVI